MEDKLRSAAEPHKGICGGAAMNKNELPRWPTLCSTTSSIVPTSAQTKPAHAVHLLGESPGYELYRSVMPEVAHVLMPEQKLYLNGVLKATPTNSSTHLQRSSCGKAVTWKLFRLRHQTRHIGPPQRLDWCRDGCGRNLRRRVR